MVRKILGSLMLIVGVCLIFGSFSWFGYLYLDSARAGRTAEETVQQLTAVIPEHPTLAETGIADSDEMRTWEANGISYLGILEIPNLDLELPVISQWSEGHAKLAPCRYAGNISSGDLILCAHNYDSHFGLLPDLQYGDRVHFTDVEGNCHIYEVTEAETLDGKDAVRMTEGNWELTLFTCTYGGTARFTVRCQRVYH